MVKWPKAEAAGMKINGSPAAAENRLRLGDEIQFEILYPRELDTGKLASGNTKQDAELNPISLSFLDVMFCGFGAVILIFLILDYASAVTMEGSDSELLARNQSFEEEIRKVSSDWCESVIPFRRGL